MPHVFISYTGHDQTSADHLCAVLERNGLSCWIAPRNIAPGFPWAETIVTAICESQLMIAVVSHHAYGSEQMAHEIERADSNKIPILPIRLDAAPLEGQFEYFLGNKQWLDLRDHAPDDCEKTLLTAVRTLQTRSNARRAAAERTQPISADAQPSTGVRRRLVPGIGVHSIVDELRAVTQTFWDIATKREAALAGLNLADSDTLFFAVRFLAYMSLVSVILHFPAWGAQGIRYAHPVFLLSALAEVLIEALALCVLLYAAIRTFGGKADLQQFFCAFCLLSTFQPMIDACLAPIYARSISVQTSDIERFLGQAAASANHISDGDLAVLLVAYLLSAGLTIVFVVALFRAFRVRDQLGIARASMAFVAGFAMWKVVVLVFSQPFEANLYTAFRQH